MHVMEIEAALANRDDLRRARQLPELRDTFRVAVPGVMRMHSDGRPHVGITFRDFDRHAIGFDRADRATDTIVRTPTSRARASTSSTSPRNLGSARWQ